MLEKVRHDQVETKSMERGDIRAPVGTTKMKKSFRYQAAKLWNETPQTLRTANTISKAKKEIKKFCKILP